MRNISIFFISFLLEAILPLQAQTLEGTFSCQGEEATSSTVQLTAIAGQPFVGTEAGSPLSYGFVENVSVVNEYTNMTALTLSQHKASIEEGESLHLMVNFTPEVVDNPTISWFSSDPTVATIKNGTVLAKSRGAVVVTAVSACGVYSDVCQITVTQSEPDPIPVTGVILEPEEVTLDIGGTFELEATVLPQNADDKRVEWNSSDEHVATVRDGVVTAIGAGMATISATTIDGGYEATCVVTVDEDPTSIEDVGSANRVSFVDGSLYFELLTPQTVSIWNVRGQVCDRIDGKAGLNIFSLQAYPAGIYFVRIENRVIKIAK